MFTPARRASSSEYREVSTDLGPPLAAGATYTRHPRRDVPSSDDDVSRHAVLIFSADPLAAALLAAAVEFAGHAPHFVQQDELARAGLRRVRPRLVVIDCDHEEACSEEFVGPARILLFRSRRTKRDIGDFATRLGLRVIEMPPEHDELTRLLAEMLA